MIQIGVLFGVLLAGVVGWTALAGYLDVGGNLEHACQIQWPQFPDDVRNAGACWTSKTQRTVAALLGLAGGCRRFVVLCVPAAVPAHGRRR